MPDANGVEARDPLCAGKGRSVTHLSSEYDPNSGVYDTLLLLLYMAG